METGRREPVFADRSSEYGKLRRPLRDDVNIMFLISFASIWPIVKSISSSSGLVEVFTSPVESRAALKLSPKERRLSRSDIVRLSDSLDFVEKVLVTVVDVVPPESWLPKLWRVEASKDGPVNFVCSDGTEWTSVCFFDTEYVSFTTVWELENANVTLLSGTSLEPLEDRLGRPLRCDLNMKSLISSASMLWMFESKAVSSISVEVDTRFSVVPNECLLERPFVDSVVSASNDLVVPMSLSTVTWPTLPLAPEDMSTLGRDPILASKSGAEWTIPCIVGREISSSTTWTPPPAFRELGNSSPGIDSTSIILCDETWGMSTVNGVLLPCKLFSSPTWKLPVLLVFKPKSETNSPRSSDWNSPVEAVPSEALPEILPTLTS